jgi:hypothetical protein
MQAQPTTSASIATSQFFGPHTRFSGLVTATRLVGTLALSLGLALSLSAQAQTTVPGKIPGSFAVSPSGAATYSIPIQVPPGVAGMEPKLSLEYNSQGGNGIMGMGWNLAGLSSITRCPATMAQDGVRGSVNYDGNDKFCLDGQRLMVVSGTYGAPGSEYRTEIDSFSQITASGQAGAGPASFTVKTKAGLTMEYGIVDGTRDSRIEAQGKSAVMVWAIGKIVDVKGNTITISYYEDTINPYFYPTRIDYAGNAVLFNYGTSARPDVISTYHAGSLVTMALRLNEITTLSGGATTTVVKLQYSASVNSERSNLSSVQICDKSNVCLYSTNVIQQTSTPSYVNSGNLNLPDVLSDYNQYNIGTQLVDLNGDGLPDFVRSVNVAQIHLDQHGRRLASCA